MIRTVVEFTIEEFKKAERIKKLLEYKQTRLRNLVDSFNEDEKQEYARLTGQRQAQEEYEVEE